MAGEQQQQRRRMDYTHETQRSAVTQRERQSGQFPRNVRSHYPLLDKAGLVKNSVSFLTAAVAVNDRTPHLEWHALLHEPVPSRDVRAWLEDVHKALAAHYVNNNGRAHKLSTRAQRLLVESSAIWDLVGPAVAETVDRRSNPSSQQKPVLVVSSDKKEAQDRAGQVRTGQQMDDRQKKYQAERAARPSVTATRTAARKNGRDKQNGTADADADPRVTTAFSKNLPGQLPANDQRDRLSRHEYILQLRKEARELKQEQSNATSRRLEREKLAQQALMLSQDAIRLAWTAMTSPDTVKAFEVLTLPIRLMSATGDVVLQERAKDLERAWRKAVTASWTAQTAQRGTTARLVQMIQEIEASEKAAEGRRERRLVSIETELEQIKVDLERQREELNREQEDLRRQLAELRRRKQERARRG